jgi:hypothetical protein
MMEDYFGSWPQFLKTKIVSDALDDPTKKLKFMLMWHLNLGYLVLRQSMTTPTFEKLST